MVIVGVLIITLVVSLSFDWLVQYIPFSYEQQLVKKYEPGIEKRNEVDTYLQGLANNVAKVMNLPTDMKISIHYVNNDTINAFATLGGHIMVFRGLMEKLPSENALVMLIAHEIAHIKLRHPLRAMSKGIVLSGLFSIILGQSSDSVSKLMNNTGMMTMLGFSREQEEKADEEGLKATWRYYHNVAGSLALFNVLQKATQGQTGHVPVLLRSHPQTMERIVHLRQMAAQHHWSLQGKAYPIPAEIRRKLAADKAGEVKEVKRSEQRGRGDLK